jgi:hypothetical protein
MANQALDSAALAPVAVVIPVCAVIVVGVAAVALKRFSGGATAMRCVVASVVWAALAGALAASGVLARFDARPQPMALFMVACLAVGAATGVSSWGSAIALRAPLFAIVLSQAFRLPLELAMHDAATRGIMPVELSFSGYNFDIVTGTLAIVVGVLAFFGKAPRALLWTWNLIGIVALIVIVVVAVASSPLLHAFGTEPAHLNTWVTQVPYVWLPSMLVAFAVAGHIVMTRALLRGE